MHSGKNFGIFSHCLIFNTFNYDFTTNSQLSELKMEVMLEAIMYGRIENDNTCYLDYNDFTEREIKKCSGYRKRKRVLEYSAEFIAHTGGKFTN